jgi:hypothetical protein
MGDNDAVLGELIYEYTAQIAQMVEYGTSATAVFSGQISHRPKGPVTGPKLKGDRQWRGLPSSALR